MMRVLLMLSSIQDKKLRRGVLRPHRRIGHDSYRYQVKIVIVATWKVVGCDDVAQNVVSVGAHQRRPPRRTLPSVEVRTLVSLLLDISFKTIAGG